MKKVYPLIIAGCLVSCADRESGENENRQKFDQLISEARRERDDWRGAGVDDGNGLLYRQTAAFRKLSDFCSSEEMAEVHRLLGPPQRGIE